MTDPTMLFAIVCAVFPALKARDPMVIIQYFTSPLCFGVAVVTAAVYAFGTAGNVVPLKAWEIRAAHWYLLNGAIFHLLLDW
jgi:hypothetical protein